jgi:hypothetical protein
MKKNILLTGLAAVVGFFALTAFGGKTAAQQLTEINASVAAKIDELRTTKAAECDAQVASAAQAKFAEMSAAPAPAPAAVAAIAAPAKGKTTKKAPVKPTTAPTRAEPLPQPSAPAPANPKDAKMSGEAPAPNTQAKDAKMSGEAPAPNTSAKNKKMGGGGK